MRCVILMAFTTGCDGMELALGVPDPWPEPRGGAGRDPESEPPHADGPMGFVGSPCAADGDCVYDGGVCLMETDGFPRGTCSRECDRLCPDADGAAVTFCAEAGDLPAPASSAVEDGACLSRCDFGLFPDAGCRPGYACGRTQRPGGGGDDRNYVCLPGRASELTACHDALAARDVPFEPSILAEESPAGHPGLVCEIADAVWLLGQVEGMALVDPSGLPTPRVLTSCEAALALADTALDLAPEGVVAIRHWGSYSCRTIAGTARLSQHAHADAFDLTGFEMDDGRTVTVLEHWEYDTRAPETDNGRLLLDAAWRWHDRRIWNVILTPDLDRAHHDHFHVDLTPGAVFIGSTDFGPASIIDGTPQGR
ncbi:MAG: extensin family protein [Myxococcota bacterium]|nr:extensin family protein [Myxococcota bacterium]